MNAGALRHVLLVQSATETRSASGAVQKDWNTVGRPLRASIDPLKGEKLVQAQQVVPRATHEVQMRGRVSLSTAQRFLYRQRVGETVRDRVFNIGNLRDLQERGITTVALVIEVPA